MLRIKTEKGDRSLEERSNFNIVHSYEGEQTLSFDISVQDKSYRYLQSREKLLYGDNRYNILKINKRKTLASIIAELDMNEWKQGIHKKFEAQNALFSDVMLQILPEGWYLQDANAAKGRGNISLEGVSDYEILMECKKEYQIVFEYHILEKYIKVIDPSIIQQRGLYLSDELNLDSVEYKGDFTNQINRLYAYGKKDEVEKEDGTKETAYVTFASINDGKEYVDCMDYMADEVLCAYWQDDKYTDAMELLRDAKEKVKELAAPVQAWSCNIYDLSRTNEKYKILNFHMYDKPVLLCDGQSIVHQIVEYTEYPDTPNLNKVVLSTTFKKVEGIVASIKTDVDSINQNLVGKEKTINELIRDVNSNSLRIENTYTKKEIETIQESILQQTNESIDISISEVNEKIDLIDTQVIQLQILTDGTTLNSNISELHLKAQLYKEAEDISETIPTISFTWQRKSKDASADETWNVAHKHIKSITVTSEDVLQSASFQVTVTTNAYTKISGYETITNENDIPNLSVYIDSNLSDFQHYNSATGTMEPSWNPLLLTPEIKDGLKQVSLSSCEVLWRRSDGDLSEDEVAIDGVLNINQNKLSEVESKAITYICEVRYKNYISLASKSFALVIDGIAGIGVKSVIIEYYLSTSKEILEDGEWSTTPPVWSTGKYIWTRTVITYTNDTTNLCEPLCDSTWEAVNTLEETMNGKIESDIDDAESRITETYNSVLDLTKDEINMSIQKISESTSSTLEMLKGVQNQLILTNEQTSFIKTTTEKLQDMMDGKMDETTIKEWARFDGSSLELGSSNSPFKAILSNTELAFWQGNTKVAWISNNELHIAHAVVMETMRVGSFQMQHIKGTGLVLNRWE